MRRLFVFPDKRPTCSRCGEKISEKNISLYNWAVEGVYRPICLPCWDFLRRYYADGTIKSEQQIKSEVERDNLTRDDLKLLQEKYVYLENNFLQ